MTVSTRPLAPGGDHGDQSAEHHRADDDGERADHRGLRAGQQPGQHVPALEVVAEQVAADGPTKASPRFGRSGL